MNISRENRVRDGCAFDYENFARLLWEGWFIQSGRMNLMSETADDLPKELIGMAIQLGPFEMDALPTKFSDMVEPFKADCCMQPAFDLDLLSQVPYPFGAYCNVHGHFGAKKSGWIRLSLIRRPSPRPPAAVKKGSALLGGYPNGFAQLMAALGEPKASLPARVRGFVMGRRRCQVRVSHRKIPKLPLLILDSDTVEFRHSKGFVKLKFEKNDDFPQFEATSQIKVKLDVNCFEEGAKQFWPLLRPFIKKNG